MTLNADPRDYDFEPWDDSYEDDHSSLFDRLSGNTGMIAGVLTVAITFSVVAANALFYQPHAHQGAMFDTSKNVAVTEPAEIKSNKVAGKTLEQEVAELPQIAPQPTSKAETTNVVAVDPQRAKVRMVQTILKELSIYDGKVDGLSGPQTRGAIATYQKIIGLPETGEIDRALLAQLSGQAAGNAPIIAQNTESQSDADITVASITPTPRPTKIDDVGALIESAPTSPSAGDDASKAMIKQLQAGLRQFNNPDITVDGIQGSKTTAALKLFQETFHLKVTGEADESVFRKMRDLGYIN